GDGGLQRRPLVQHQVEQAVRVGQLVRRRVRLQEQRTGPLDAQGEIDQGEQLRITSELVEIELDVNVPELVACQPVSRIELQSPTERQQGRSIASDRRMTDAAQDIL